MQKRQLEWSKRASADLVKIVDFYLTEASPVIAEDAMTAFDRAAKTAAANPLHYREGKKPGTREYVMRRFPYTLIFRSEGPRIIIVRVLHQSGRYFN
jgi:plasmid stabilization system protein ParE